VSAHKSKVDTFAWLWKQDAAKEIKKAGTGGRVEIDLDGFEAAYQRFGRTVGAFGDLVWTWQSVADVVLPLGNNPIGRAVACRFVAMSGKLFAALRDYGGKLEDAQKAMRAVALEHARLEGERAEDFAKVISEVENASIYAKEAMAYVNSMAVVQVTTQASPAEQAESAAWRPADKGDWWGYTSHELYVFATDCNSPEMVTTAVDQWWSKANALRDTSTALLNDVGGVMSTWRGVAADKARAILEPLALWSGAAAGNADRLRQNLRKAGDAAAHLKGMPRPVEEFNLQAELDIALAGSPAAAADLNARQLQAQAVKAEQVRYLEQYEATMAAVYDALPDFHLAPVAGPTEGDTGSGNRGTGVPAPNVPAPNAPVVRSQPPAPRAPASASNTADTTSGRRPARPSTRTTVPATFVSPDVTGARPRSGPPSSGPPAPEGDHPARSGPLVGGGVSGTPGEGRRPIDGRGFGGGRGAVGGGGRVFGESRAVGGTTRGPDPAATERTSLVAPRRGAETAPVGATGKRPDREEDAEHERPSYLVERDPEDVFGTNERTAPPVIG
jgi:hypothetical protein